MSPHVSAAAVAPTGQRVLRGFRLCIYDVFLSHNSQDKPEVERVAERLKREGIEAWLDIWCLTPGGDWQDELAQGLRVSPACAVFVGAHGIGDWERLELNLATDRMAKDRTFRVFLVLLPGLREPFDTSTLPPFLSTRTWVDLRKGIFDPRGVQLLINAVKGLAPGPEIPIEPRTDLCPYRGLQAFDEEHAEFFFGREADTQRLIEKLKSTRFLSVLGPSGSGKSSLVRAGLLPTLRMGGLSGSDTWAIRVFTPGARPLTALAANYVRLYPQASMGKLLDELVAEERALHLSVSLALADRPSAERVVWVVDQLEEDFTLCNDETERVRFLENLAYAARIPGGRNLIMLTIRADFYPRCAAYPELAALIAAEQYLVSPMDVDSLRRVIEEPAWRVGLQLEPGLVETILEDVESQPGALPLLEHALLELWQRRRGRLLTLEGYRESGAVEGALAKRADTIYTVFTPEQQGIARRILLRLTQPGDGTEDTRRRASLSELVTRPEQAEQVRNVVQTMADARLLTTDSGFKPDGQGVEVSHETLIRGWPRLRRWIDEDREGLLIHRRLGEAAAEWHQRGEEESVLFRGTRLAEAAEWRVRYGAELNELERRFLDASIALRHREARERQEIHERELTQARALTEEQRRRAEAERQRAEEQAWSTRRLRTRFLAAMAFALAALVAAGGFVTAFRRANSERVRADNGTRLAAGDSAGKVILWQVDPTPRLAVTLRAAEHVWAVAYSRDGTRLVSGESNGVIRLWAPKKAEALGPPLHVPEDKISNLKFSPDGRQLAIVGMGDITLWDVEAGRATGRMRHGDARPRHIPTVAYSPDGGVLATGAMDGVIRLWNTAHGDLIRALDAHKATVLALAFSPDGSLLASGGGEGTLRLWRPGTGELALPPLATEAPAIYAVQFLPGGRQVLSVSRSAIVRWDTRTGKPLGNPLPLGNDQDTLGAVAFGLHGTRLALLLRDGSIRLWDLEAGVPLPETLRLVQFVPALSIPNYGSIAFSPDGLQLATAALGPRVLLWDVDPLSWERQACRIANRDLTREEWDEYIGPDVTYRRTCVESSFR